MLGAGEDQHRLGVGLVQQAQQQRGLEVRRHRVQRVGDGAQRLAGADLHRHRVAQHVLRQAADVGGHGGREQQGLALGRQVLQHAAHVGQEAHVKHAVGLVQHQHFHAGQADVALREVVQQAARAGHHDFDAARSSASAAACPRRRTW